MKRTGPSLSEIPRHELIAAALELGIERPEQLSIEELRDKIRAASEAEAVPERVSLFSVARNLIASVVERGLNLPDAARVIRDTVRSAPRHRPPLPTVTLAQIYLAQGYTDRAIQTLLQVIEREPSNYTAAELYQRLTQRAADSQAVSTREPSSSAGATPAAPAHGSERTSVAPGLTPDSQLWFESGRSLTRGLRDALVLIEREARQVTVYWELSDPHAAELSQSPSEVRVLCHGGAVPREINLPVRGSVGWALVELLDDELPRACLTVGGKVVASAIHVRVSAPSTAVGETFEPRKEVVSTSRARGFWDDVVHRALQ
jgi:hypothetical protein